MTAQITAEELREGYLKSLDAATGDLSHRLAVELHAGIAEELQGLDKTATAQRIAELGSPTDVARAAIEAGFGTMSVSPAGPLPAHAVKPPLAETRGYAVVAAIVLGAGGMVIPVVGWCIGVVLVSTSRLWTRAEKLWGVLFPIVALVAISAAVALVTGLTDSGSAADAVGFYAPKPNGFSDNAAFDSVWSVALGGWLLAPCSALWLILRLRGRCQDPVSAQSA